MKPEGSALFNLREKKNVKIYSQKIPSAQLAKTLDKKLKSNKAAWKFFQSMPPSYQKTTLQWIMSAKKEETRLKRLQALITDCESKRKIKPLSYGKK